MIEPRLRRLFTERFSDVVHPRFVAAQAPGRLEVSGNHTDHQGGCVLSAALDYYTTAIAAPNGLGEIRVVFDGYGSANLTLPMDLTPQADEIGTSVSMLRGMIATYVEAGGEVSGFDMAVCSTIPAGGGVSSSAALEMLIGVVLRGLAQPDGWEGELALSDEQRIKLALQGQRAEREYFGKMCGAQDQLASAMGGLVFMDFKESVPKARRISADFSGAGYDIVLINSGVDHSAYTSEYDQVPKDMLSVAASCGANRLADVALEDFEACKSQLVSELGSDVVNRAQHYFEETNRVQQQVKLLASDDIERFLQEVIASGNSSATQLCNVVPKYALPEDTKAYLPQRILDCAAQLLANQGAWRIHGGGFGGSILTFVPHEQTEAFIAQMEKLVAPGACMVVGVSDKGAHAWSIDASQALSSFAWKGCSDFGELELTINLAKPEKDPLNIKQATCALCRENDQYNVDAETRCDARVEQPEFIMNNELWRLHFSPYGYYPKHCIVMSKRHYPMAITQHTCNMLLECVDRWPYYFMGSNADLPIVGGSILEHDHFQGGGHVFPLMKRPIKQPVCFEAYPEVLAGIVDWPASVLRLTSANVQALADCAWQIIATWKQFTCKSCGIVSSDVDGQHSTVTPIAYCSETLCGEGIALFGPGAQEDASFVQRTSELPQGNQSKDSRPQTNRPQTYVLDLVLRNNLTTQDRPFGVFHPDVDLHHIKKENIGLIEIMGRAILPPRVLETYPDARTSTQAQQELTVAFQRILEATGVFKNDDAGWQGWKDFIQSCHGEF